MDIQNLLGCCATIFWAAGAYRGASRGVIHNLTLV
jgi:hypothetical protein